MADAGLNAVSYPVKGLIPCLVGGCELREHDAKGISKRVNLFFCLEPHAYSPSTVDTASTYMNR